MSSTSYMSLYCATLSFHFKTSITIKDVQSYMIGRFTQYIQNQTQNSLCLIFLFIYQTHTTKWNKSHHNYIQDLHQYNQAKWQIFYFVHKMLLSILYIRYSKTCLDVFFRVPKLNTYKNIIEVFLWIDFRFCLLQNKKLNFFAYAYFYANVLNVTLKFT